MVGQLALPETPFLDVIYKEEGATVYLIHDGDELILHAEVEGKITHNRLKHFDRIFLAIVLGLIERGLDHIVAWVPVDQGNLNFASYFGFEELNTIRVLPQLDSSKKMLREMIYIFPKDDDDQENT